ncbi:MAG: hypothetical protein ABI333_24855 [bacterium]
MILDELLTEWRADGYDENALEVWSIGHAGNEPVIDYYAGDTTSSCFADASPLEESVYTLYGALQDDLLLLDSFGVIRHHVSTYSMPLTDEAHRATVDTWVRELLP